MGRRKKYFYEKLLKNSEFGYNRTEILGILLEALSAFLLLTAVRNVCPSTRELIFVSRVRINTGLAGSDICGSALQT
jgi:hypothetical protein